jgi:heme-degrading monooxygenase HmoA
MAHVRVATYSVDPRTSNEWLGEVESGIVPIYKDHPGFRSFSLVEAGDTIVSITHWNSEEEAEAASEAGSSWAKDPASGRVAIKRRASRGSRDLAHGRVGVMREFLQRMEELG